MKSGAFTFLQLLIILPLGHDGDIMGMPYSGAAAHVPVVAPLFPLASQNLLAQ